MSCRDINASILVVISSFSTFFISTVPYRHVLLHFQQLGSSRSRQTPRFVRRKSSNSAHFFRKQFFVIKLRKIISPSLLTRFYPRFRPQFRLRKYFLNIWSKVTHQPLIFPRFAKSGSRYLYSVKMGFPCYQLVQSHFNQQSTIS